jgi:hypothetical protein
VAKTQGGRCIVSCKHVNEQLRFPEGGEFPELLSDYKVLKDSVLWLWLPLYQNEIQNFLLVNIQMLTATF